MPEISEQLTPKQHESHKAREHSHTRDDVFTKAGERPRRTVGERLVDTIVYPIVNNIAVFGISVGATYLTHRGDTVGKEGSTMREVGGWFKRRGEWMKEKFKSAGMNEAQADMGKMVFFSFADGTVVAPFVKVLEDRRENMAKWIDERLGTKPADESVYKVEPKQTWGSVLKGRLATSLIVVPTAVALDGIRINNAGQWSWRNKDGGRNLNDRMFDGSSEKIANWLEDKTHIKKRFPKLDIPYLSKTIAFEAFYTSVCTGGLYVISRFIAKHNKDHKKALEEYKAHHSQPTTANTAPNDAAPGSDYKDAPAKPSAPATNVSETTHLARLANLPSVQEITA